MPWPRIVTMPGEQLEVSQTLAKPLRSAMARGRGVGGGVRGKWEWG